MFILADDVTCMTNLVGEVGCKKNCRRCI